MFGEFVYKFNTLYSPCLVIQPNYLNLIMIRMIFRYDKKLAIFENDKEKSMGLTNYIKHMIFVFR